MKNLILIICLMGLIPANLWAWKPDKWTVEDTIFQCAVFTTLFLDCNQTYLRDGYRETNPILGKYPSDKKVNTYFFSCALLHTGISYILPKPYRNFWQGICIGFESCVIYDNYKIGIKFEF